MPPRRKTASRAKPRAKRVYRKKRYGIPRNPNNSIAGVIPASRIVNMAYSMRGGLSCGLGGVPAKHAFNLNSIFDPDYSIIGHQPLGHDQWANFYERYQVLGAKITATFQWQGSALVGQPHMCGIIIDHDTTDYTNTDELVERSHGKGVKILKSNSRDSQTCVAYYSAKNFFKGNKEALDTQNVLFGYSPSYGVYGKVWIGSVDSVASVEDIQIAVHVDYLVRLLQPKDITQS